VRLGWGRRWWFLRSDLGSGVTALRFALDLPDPPVKPRHQWPAARHMLDGAVELVDAVLLHQMRCLCPHAALCQCDSTQQLVLDGKGHIAFGEALQIP
jgi:hypothetical protein